MKKTITLFLVLAASVSLYAQMPIAILDHNDTTTAYYGAAALSQAHSAAVDGDIITLSPGAFDGITISKRITIRGAGMFYDSIAGTYPTVLRNTYIRIDNSLPDTLRIEGIDFAESLSCCKATQINISKCYIKNFNRYPTNSTSIATRDTLRYVNLHHCIFERFTIDSSFGWNNNGYSSMVYHYMVSRDVHFYNCAILRMYTYDNLPSNNGIQLFNCVVNMCNSQSYSNSSYFNNLYVINSVLLSQQKNSNGSISTYTQTTSSPYRYNCIGTSGYSFSTSILDAQNVHNISSISGVFTDFAGTYSKGVTTFTLTESAAAILGSDSTQIGIYGGANPFNPRLDTNPPIIGRCNVPLHSNAEGRLNIGIEVITE